MIEKLISGIVDNWFIVLISFLMLFIGTIETYRRFGLKRVLLGKSGEHRELIYRKDNGDIDWKPTLNTWFFISTGGLSILSIFLLFMLLVLSFVYAHDIQAMHDNDAKFCNIFGTVNPSEEQLSLYYTKNHYTYELDLDLKQLDFPIKIKSGDNGKEKT